MARTTKTTDELLASALSALQAPAASEKSIEEKQRDEAIEHVRGTFATALSELNTDAFTGEARDLVAKAAANLTSALRNATAAVKKQDNPSNLPGVKTQEPYDGPAVLAD